jgi:hypothetical protein
VRGKIEFGAEGGPEGVEVDPDDKSELESESEPELDGLPAINLLANK